MEKAEEKALTPTVEEPAPVGPSEAEVFNAWCEAGDIPLPGSYDYEQDLFSIGYRAGHHEGWKSGFRKAVKTWINRKNRR